ncbi:RidA family protein [Streptomyces iranensis]|uniref:2-iminobutanoate/2-iminopropanoate deaminase n=1 Tax=Streptomyces iranensis TaxID=576784 RepID=A0ABS4MYW7_9ACTN|nr:RidA family protein [Streptomyces iranensis]MBP2064942.1 2-iminobutanoate/2-iminopropanoate deaminase [Streptomyces iranensis]
MASVITRNVENLPNSVPLSSSAQVGDLIFTSGMGGMDAETGEVVSDDVCEQMDVAVARTVAVLEASGCTLSDVVKVVLYLTDPADYDRINEVYVKWFGDHRPARTCIVAGGLPSRERVKLDTIASQRES